MSKNEQIGKLFDLVISNLKKMPEEEQRFFIVQLFVRLKMAGYDKLLEELK